MSLAEARRDDVRVVIRNGRTAYYPKCQFCGAEVRVISYLPRNHYTCEACRPYKALFRKTSRHA